MAPHVALIDHEAVTIFVECRCCDTKHHFVIPNEDYFEWQMGLSIQKACPYFDPDTAEILISGICSTCFDSLFSEKS